MDKHKGNPLAPTLPNPAPLDPLSVLNEVPTSAHTPARFCEQLSWKLPLINESSQKQALPLLS